MRKPVSAARGVGQLTRESDQLADGRAVPLEQFDDLRQLRPASGSGATSGRGPDRLIGRTVRGQRLRPRSIFRIDELRHSAIAVSLAFFRPARRTKDDDRRKSILPSAWGAARRKKRLGWIRCSPCLWGENLRIVERIFEVNQRCVRGSVYCVLIDSGGHNERLSCEVL